MMRAKLYLVVMSCVLCACASAPKIDYYTLGAESSGEVMPDVNIVVERFRTTEALGRSQILVAPSETRVEYYANDQWAGGVGELVQQKLAAEFGPPMAGRTTVRLSGTVLACEQVDTAAGANGRLKVFVTLRDPEQKRYRAPLLEKTYEASCPATQPTADAVVNALARCAERIAGEIAEDAGQF
jgi:ABC-type uncharacterized transport system auxiliary subunit